jgi:hypothetical protein
MFYIDNPSGNPIIETVKKAFSDKTPVTLVIEYDGKLLNIPSYMSELIIPNGPPFELNIRIQSSQEPIWIYTVFDQTINRPWQP